MGGRNWARQIYIALENRHAKALCSRAFFCSLILGGRGLSAGGRLVQPHNGASPELDRVCGRSGSRVGGWCCLMDRFRTQRRLLAPFRFPPGLAALAEGDGEPSADVQILRRKYPSLRPRCRGDVAARGLLDPFVRHWAVGGRGNGATLDRSGNPGLCLINRFLSFPTDGL